jgi:N6-adenosine-specific RNA methylase IME4
MAFLKKSKDCYYIHERKEGKEISIKSLGRISKEEAQQQLVIWKEESIRLANWKKLNPMPNGTFDIIYADPPWRYEHPISNSRKIENQYPTMELGDIKTLKIPVAEDSILFLWATAPKLTEAMDVINAWGFLYRTNLVWVKDKIGMGYYVRGRHELLLIATKGKPKVPATADRQDSIINAGRGEHSEKPQVTYDIIESAFPNGKYLELFARQKHSDKWTVWGNEV